MLSLFQKSILHTRREMLLGSRSHPAPLKRGKDLTQLPNIEMESFRMSCKAVAASTDPRSWSAWQSISSSRSARGYGTLADTFRNSQDKAYLGKWGHYIRRWWKGPKPGSQPIYEILWGKNILTRVLLELKHGFDPVQLRLFRLKKCYLEKKKTSMQVGCSSQGRGRNRSNFKEPGHTFDVVSLPAPTRLWPSLNNELFLDLQKWQKAWDPGARGCWLNV